MASLSGTPAAVRMRRRRAHDNGDHRQCVPHMCELAYAELRLLRALLAQQPTETSVRVHPPRASETFARRQKGTRMPARSTPANTPFGYGDRCKTPNAEPEWFDSGDGRWQRTCSCGDEFKAMYSGELEPAGPAAEPAKTAHQHFPDCEGAQVASMVTVEFSSADRCWRSHCLLCTSTYLYWYQPDRHETNHYGEPVPVRRAGNLLYDYPLASEQVPA
jgi:hypothetical protein